MKSLIPKGWYTATITQVYIKEVKKSKRLNICFTIDTGEYSYQHIIREYPLNEWGIEKLVNNFLEIGFIVYKDYKDKLFTEQFEKLRAEIHVDRGRVDDVITNYILEMRQTTKDPEYDVTRPKSEDHFHKNNKGRKLPIWKKDSGTTKKKQFKKS